MDHTARLDLPFIMAGQALKHITHNEALDRLDILVQPIVQSASLATPPAAPLPGEAWIVPAGATGVWSGHGGEIAAFQAGAWRFYDPAQGWQVFDRAAEALLIYSGAAWVAVAATGAGLPQLGVNTSADATNRLAVAAEATLLTHAGAGHQVKVNKGAAAQTASLLFQSNWSGRAEMGLMGDDNWRIKVSPDGSTWRDAITVNAATGAASFVAAPRPAADNTLSWAPALPAGRQSGRPPARSRPPMPASRRISPPPISASISSAPSIRCASPGSRTTAASITASSPRKSPKPLRENPSAAMSSKMTGTPCATTSSSPP